MTLLLPSPLNCLTFKVQFKSHCQNEAFSTLALTTQMPFISEIILSLELVQLLCKRACFPTLSPALDITVIFNLCQSIRWKIFSCYYNVHFFNYEWQMFIDHLWGVTTKCLFLFFVFCLLISTNYLRMMEIGLLPVTCIKNIFSSLPFFFSIVYSIFSHINALIFFVKNFIIIFLLCRVCTLYHTKDLISKSIFKNLPIFPLTFLWFYFFFFFFN